jgi:hypothetical protein
VGGTFNGTVAEALELLKKKTFVAIKFNAADFASTLNVPVLLIADDVISRFMDKSATQVKRTTWTYTSKTGDSAAAPVGCCSFMETIL